MSKRIRRDLKAEAASKKSYKPQVDPETIAALKRIQSSGLDTPRSSWSEAYEEERERLHAQDSRPSTSSALVDLLETSAGLVSMTLFADELLTRLEEEDSEISIYNNRRYLE